MESKAEQREVMQLKATNRKLQPPSLVLEKIWFYNCLSLVLHNLKGGFHFSEMDTKIQNYIYLLFEKKQEKKEMTFAGEQKTSQNQKHPKRNKVVEHVIFIVITHSLFPGQIDMTELPSPERFSNVKIIKGPPFFLSCWNI